MAAKSMPTIGQIAATEITATTSKVYRSNLSAARSVCCLICLLAGGVGTVLVISTHVSRLPAP